MISLNTRQRDLLEYLLRSQRPVVVAEIASHMHLTPRQVSYGLKYVKSWLAQRDVKLRSKSGTGLHLECSGPERIRLLNELASLTAVQLVLSPGERQQLAAIKLLTSDHPIILYQLQHDMQVSRTTLLKDLDIIEEWARSQKLELQRRPNYGFFLDGTEFDVRQALIVLLWGDPTFGTPIIQASHLGGLQFTLADHSTLLGMVAKVNALTSQWSLERPQSWVNYAERALETQFSDEASLHLSVVFALQQQRARQRHSIVLAQKTIGELERNPVWEVAEKIYQHMWLQLPSAALQNEIAYIAIHLISGSRSGVFRNPPHQAVLVINLIEQLMEQIAQALGVASLRSDEALRQGLATHLIPLYFRQQFNLWTPPARQTAVLSDEYAQEHALARSLADTIAVEIDIQLPQTELNNLALLLRAAYLRLKPQLHHKVIVVCPSGIATSQLLVARLAARFPQLANIETLSVRELTPEKIRSAQFIVSTVPLPSVADAIDIIQVHPLLKPEDIERIRQKIS